MPDTANIYDDMPVHDDYLPEDLFTEFVKHMPQVCVDPILETQQGYLLAKRDITPPVWFWPGSRLYKGEQLTEAAHRIAAEELDIDITIEDQCGPYAHFWEESSIEGSPSRHTVNLVFHVTPTNNEYDIQLDDQHTDYRFVTELEPDMHPYVRQYLTDNDLV
jgi:colanic acid biosynthesis protein WcaH